MQSVSISQVNGCHAYPTSAIVALVIVANSLTPELTNLEGAAIAEAYVDQEITVFKTRLEIGGGRARGPVVDARSKEIGRIPAANLAGPFRLVVE